MTTKLFVLDTSVLLHDPEAIFKFADNEVHIPPVVFWELDKKKTTNGVVGFNSRDIARTLNQILESTGPGVTSIEINADLGQLVIGTGGTNSHLPADLQIIEYAKELSSLQSLPVVLVSKDVYLRNAAMVQGILAEDYKHERVEQPYNGTRQLYAHPEEINALYVEPVKLVSLSEDTLRGLEDLSPNECVTLVDNTNTTRHGLCRYHQRTKSLQLIKTHDRNFSVCGIKPLNSEQKFALDLLLDPEVKFLSIIGVTGSGKTLLALAAALHQVTCTGEYEKIIVTRKQVTVGGEELGFLPGDINEKTKPWMEAIYGCLGKIARYDKNVRQDKMLAHPHEAYTGSEEGGGGIVEIKPMGFVRGVTWDNSVLLVDESQNMHINEIKALATRAGKGSKVIIMGDADQIDLEVSRYLDAHSNGLTLASQKMRGWEASAHVTLFKTERSELSSEVAKRL